MTLARVRTYGTMGPRVVVLHGGPGAPGYMAPVARELGRSFRVFEPFQQGSGAERLTVARHVEDLHDLVESLGKGARPALVGHSWGAMLALAYASDHPGSAGPLALIGCGTFDPEAREWMSAICKQRMDENLRRRMDRLPLEFPDPDERLRELGNLYLPIYSHELITTDLEVEACDARAHRESWDDMLRLQEEGIYPAAFAAIHSPAILLHGAADPHPGDRIRRSLEPHLPQLEYHQWEDCGHYPWLEKAARRDFFTVLRQWLTREMEGAGRE